MKATMAGMVYLAQKTGTFFGAKNSTSEILGAENFTGAIFGFVNVSQVGFPAPRIIFSALKNFTVFRQGKPYWRST